MTRKKILAISGSTRANSTNESILNFITNKYTNLFDVIIYSGIPALPHFNPDLENDKLPQSVKDFREQLQDVDGVIICTPEYVFSLPGALKNAIEWTVSTTIFSDKPVALIVASAAGEKTFESLLLIMNTLGAKIGEHAKILIQGARSKIIDGLLEDKTTQADIQKLITSFQETLNNKR